MKNIIAIIFLAFMASSAHAQVSAQSPNLIWATPCSGSGFLALRAPCAADISTILAAGTVPANFTSLGLSTILTVGATGLDGGGTVANNTNFQTALTAAAAGGSMALPCGIFNFTNASAVTVTVAAGKNVTVKGSGVDCTVLKFTNSTGFALAYGGLYSSVTFRDLTFMTDQAGTFDAITLTEAGVNTNPALSAQSIFQNVNFIGTDSYSGSPTKYWRTGIGETNVSNINIKHVVYVGPTGGSGGDAIKLLGNVGGGGYSVATNIDDLAATGQGSCVNIGDYVQGLTIDHSNCTGGVTGVVTPSSAAGVIGGFTISHSQFGNNSGLDINIQTPSAHIVDVLLDTDYFIDNSTGGGVVIAGSRPQLVNDDFVGAGPTTGPAITMNGSVGTITGGSIVGYTTGVSYGAASSRIIQTGTEMAANTTDYTVNASATNIVINDFTPRNISKLWTCQVPITGSRAFLSDTVASASPTYHGSVAGGGATTINTPAYCDGSGTWKYD